MTADEIATVLRANIGRRVAVTYCDGDTDIVKVLTVDDEGFVFEAAPEPGDNTAMFWSRFEDIVDLRTDAE